MGFTDNPIISSPFDPPLFHYELDEEGQPTGVKLPGRRESIQVVPVPAARRRGPKQAELALFDQDGAKVTSNALINEIRKHVNQWRALPPSQWGVTPETQRLLLHWGEPSRARRLFFCQREAVETLIYLTEVAPARFKKQIQDANAEANPGLYRLASKMATGSGKTTVMGMIIAWHAVNKARRPNAKTFSDAFLIVAPGITIRDRLRVLIPSDPENIYEALSLVPTDLLDGVRKARIVITNYHAFMLRETEQVSKLNRQILGGRGPEKTFTETEGEMIARVAPELMGRKNIIVLNDEAHHCYRHKVGSENENGEPLTAEEKEEAKRNEEAARVWINGIEAFSRKIGVQAIYDLSATPFFLKGSGYPEGTLFPWVTSDFGLLDAIESGIVKVPRLPVLDDSIQGELPKFRDVYRYVSKGLPKRGRGKQSKALMDPQALPHLLLQATEALYNHYKATYAAWEAEPDLGRPPVFIVVCNNTATSKLMADWISGYEVTEGEGENAQTRFVPGRLNLFSNVDERGQWLGRRRTLLIDSEQLDSGEALSDEFRTLAADEIQAFKKELRLRNDPRDIDKLTDADILREVMNTVGRIGKLGADIRCVVSVSMLTEGWDANTVTHIMGVRAFGTQLLCEQVVGRGLRRVSYETDPTTGFFPVEYADVLGVPFTFAQQGKNVAPLPPPKVTRVRAMEDRGKLEIRFPNVEGYRIVFPRKSLRPVFTADSKMTLTPDDIPMVTEVEPLIGEGFTLDLRTQANQLRLKTVIFDVAGLLLRTYFKDPDGALQVWRYPELTRITERWFMECLTCAGETVPQFLKWRSLAIKAAEKIYRALAPSLAGPPDGSSGALLPILNPYNPEGTTRHVDFNTSKTTVLATRADKCHLNFVVYDQAWEAGLAARLEGMSEVIAYAKNHNLSFEVPYEFGGETLRYRPDYIVRINDGAAEPLNLVIELKGQRDEKDAAKAETMRNIWVPAVNNFGRFGRWGFLELNDVPYDAAARIRDYMRPLLAAE
ncbi:BPTD_3080 family restriction endonuclease [Allomesorhizobium alhagi]|uniref:Type III restriction enzyme res subunit n=1 Tax=Mesorhizobium alhagi CCNWXJ12-2 TaxID=1107882 RepID=H0HXR2_9HYPH|nr:DEAD/DEAH box helicase family protein [Mesorhizobium alhagi]EHK54476.1 type III restriction enzyme res subunit [Mesorhizobium alhagi CCNWXJ12-2]